MKKSDAIDPPQEDCLDTKPLPRFAAPAQFVDPQHEFRLIQSLGNVAKLQDPTTSLAHAAIALSGSQYLMTTASPQKDVALGNAFADLAVTGRVAYTKFQQSPPTQASIELRLRELKSDPLMQPLPTELVSAIGPALDRAYAVAWALRGPALQRNALRERLGWVAVSGEHDKPHRPVNDQPVIGDPPPFEQFEITVTTAVPGPPEHNLSVRTRFFIASAVNDTVPATIPPSSRMLPPDPVPRIPAGHQVILFLHGHSSGAEEALTIIPHILQAGLARGRKYAVISFDLPNNGYSETFDHERVAHRDGTSWPSAPLDTRLVHTPILDYIENFVVDFVDTLHQITPIKNRFAGVIGGSLGGNLGLRLGQRDLTNSPWLKAGIVSWSAASVWKPMVNSFTNSVAPGVCWGESIVPETIDSRRDYFSAVYEEAAIKTGAEGKRTQPEMWYRDGWECKALRIQESRMARQEVYDANLRQWHWRLAGEQLIFSHIDHIGHDSNQPRRYELNKVRHLLVAGQMDNFVGTRIFDCTRDLVDKLMNTPGLSLFLKDTGHSIHIERPRFFASEIVNFLLTALGGLVFCDYQQKVINIWNPMGLGVQGSALMQNTPSRLYDLPVLNRSAHSVQVTAVRIVSSEDVPGAPVFSVTSQPPFSVGAGQSYWMQVGYNGTTHGPLTGFVEVECDDPTAPIARIPLSATVVEIKRPDLRMAPAALDLGPRLVGTTVSEAITIENIGDGDATFANIELSPAGSFTIHPSYPALSLPGGLAAKSSAVIRVVYQPTARGASAATLAINVRSQDPLYKRSYAIPLAATATMPTIFLARGPQRWVHGLPGEPDRPIRDIELKVLDFGTIEPTQSSAASFWIRNVGDATLTVQGVVVYNQGNFGVTDSTSFPALLQPGSEIEVLCGFLAPPVPGMTVAGTFRVLSDDPLRMDSSDPLLPGAVIEVKGRSGGPNLTEPIEFEQGVVVVSPSVAATLTLRSDGTDPVTVRGVKLIELNRGTNFSVRSVPEIATTLVLAPGTELTLTVALTAIRRGVYEADLIVAHNGNPHRTSQVRLRGNVQ